MSTTGKPARGGKDGYQPGRAPYQAARGGRGKRGGRDTEDREKHKNSTHPSQSKAEKQFDMIFGGAKEEKKSKADQVPPTGHGPQIDSAIVLEDDAIIMDDDAIIIEESPQHKLS